MKLTEISSAKKVIVKVKRRGYPTQSVVGTVRQITRTNDGQPFILVEIGKDKLARVFPQDVKEYFDEDDS